MVALFHNFLADFGASSNVIACSVYQKINVFWEKSMTRIIQLDRSYVKVMGELKELKIRLSFDPKVHQIIDAIVANIREAYGLLLSRDRSAKLQVHFSIDYTHLWIPYKGRTKPIRVDNKSHMKHIVTNIEGKNEAISITHTIKKLFFKGLPWLLYIA